MAAETILVGQADQVAVETENVAETTTPQQVPSTQVAEEVAAGGTLERLEDLELLFLPTRPRILLFALSTSG